MNLIAQAATNFTVKASILLWLIYLLAQTINIVAHAGLATRSQYTPWKSVKQYLSAFWPQLLLRISLASGVFILWWSSPSKVNSVIAFPLNYGTAFVYGFFSDGVLDKVVALVLPQAKIELPSIPDQVPEKAKAEGAGGN